jgi:hypothetical protein
VLANWYETVRKFGADRITGFFAQPQCKLIKETTTLSHLFGKWFYIQLWQTQDTAGGNAAN